MNRNRVFGSDRVRWAWLMLTLGTWQWPIRQAAMALPSVPQEEVEAFRMSYEEMLKRCDLGGMRVVMDDETKCVFTDAEGHANWWSRDGYLSEFRTVCAHSGSGFDVRESAVTTGEAGPILHFSLSRKISVGTFSERQVLAIMRHELTITRGSEAQSGLQVLSVSTQLEYQDPQDGRVLSPKEIWPETPFMRIKKLLTPKKNWFNRSTSTTQ